MIRESSFWQQGVFKKYSTLVVSIIIFVVLDISILVLNYQQSSQVEEATFGVSVAARQGVLMENLSKDLMDINLLAERMNTATGKIDHEIFKEETFRQYNDLVRSADTFEKTLHAFTNGGKTTDLNNQTVDILPNHLDEAKSALEFTTSMWTPFRGLLDAFHADYRNNRIDIENIKFASDYVRIYGKRMVIYMNEFSAILQSHAEKQTTTIRHIQIFGIVAALLIFLFIALYVLSSLFKTDRQLESARRETADIMRTIKEGLFLLDSEMVIGNAHSAELSSILGKKEIGGKKLADLLRKIIPGKDMETACDFIEQLFNQRVVEDLITDLNPLERVLVYVPTSSGEKQQRYLSFKFFRVYEGKEISRVLVSVSDITHAVQLEERLEKERKQHDEELEMLASLLHLEFGVFSAFLAKSKQTSQTINEILKQPSTTQHYLRDKVSSIFREVHSLKGEASALKLEHYVSLMQAIEDQLHEMRDAHRLTGEDFLPLTVNLEKLITLNDKIAMLGRRLNRGLGAYAVSSGRQGDANPGMVKSDGNKEFFEQFADEIAQRNNKKVHLQCHGFSDFSLSDEKKSIIKDLSIQLLRNAVVHGIELPENRLAHGKTEHGRILLTLSHTGEGIMQLVCEDDGGGIDFEALRKQAVLNGVTTEEKAQSLTRKDLLLIMLRPGISTLSQINEDAGQGVGSDIIVNRIKQLNGRLNITSEDHRFTRFVIAFPLG